MFHDLGAFIGKAFQGLAIFLICQTLNNAAYGMPPWFAKANLQIARWGNSFLALQIFSAKKKIHETCRL